MAQTLTDTLNAAPGTWVVASRTEDLDPEDRFARWLDQRVQPVQRWGARGVRVWHIRRPLPVLPVATVPVMRPRGHGRAALPAPVLGPKWAPPRASPAHRAPVPPLRRGTAPAAKDSVH
jgi:hypothetical protein